MVRAVLDSVIFVRGLINPSSKWGRVVFDVTDDYDLVVSPTVTFEILEVINRPKLIAKFRTLPGRDARRVADRLAAAVVVEPETIEAISRDPTDDKFLAAARTGGAAYLVTEDDDLLSLGTYGSTQIVDASTFLDALSGRSRISI